MTGTIPNRRPNSLWLRFRSWLILRLVGKNAIVANMWVQGAIYIPDSYGVIVANCRFHCNSNDPTVLIGADNSHEEYQVAIKEETNA